MLHFRTFILSASVIIGTMAIASAVAKNETRLTVLAPEPEWAKLNRYQQQMTRAEFVRLMDRLYAPYGGFWSYARLAEDRVIVYADRERTQERFTLRFAQEKDSKLGNTKPFQDAQKPSSSLLQKPLAGLRICLDPGHIGGEWSKVEERWFQLGKGTPVEEASLTLQTCRHIARQLEELGAEVVWTKQNLEPVTSLRPTRLRTVALKELRENGVLSSVALSKPLSGPLAVVLQKAQEKIFYRNAEIRARAQIVGKLKPDLTLCLHYNADEWGDPESPQLVTQDRLVVFVHGAYSAGELAFEDERFDLLRKLLERSAKTELVAAESIATAMARTLKRPPELYKGKTNVVRLGESGYVFARNLLANRLFPGPVVFVEGPYMNARGTYAHLQLGDYEGLQKVNGRLQLSLHRQFANAVVEGVQAYAEHFTLREQ